MTDDLDARVADASSADLRRLMAVADSEPRNTAAAVPHLAEPRMLIAELRGVAADMDCAGFVGAVLGPNTSLADLMAAHDGARRLVTLAKGLRPRAAAELLYQATVAAAFLTHGANIAARPISARRDLFSRLAAELGDGPLAAVFEGACRKIGGGPAQ